MSIHRFDLDGGLASQESSDVVLGGTLGLDWMAPVVAYRAKGQLRGAAGVVIPTELVTAFAADVRARVGAILQLIPKVFVMDDLSLEWLAHFGLQGEKGGDPRWLRPAPLCGDDPKVTEVREAFNRAIAGKPMVLVPHGFVDASHVPLFRWAQEYGALAMVQTGEEVVEPTVFPWDRLEQEQARARETLERMRPGRAADKVKKLFGSSRAQQPVATSDRRVLELGRPFDPAEHYDDHYYGVDGKGILYCRPDGVWETYRGTAHSWEGNRTVAQILTDIVRPERKVMADLGAGSGDFVGRMLDVGWDAVGIDISNSGRRHAREDVKPRLQVYDITKQDCRDGNFSLVTAWDFLEHVWADDVDTLLAGVTAMLAPRGIFATVICTRGDGERDYVYEKGAKVTTDNAWLLVSGHVHIRRWGWWARKFREHKFRLRYDLMALFQVRRAEDPGLRTALSWSPRNVLIGELDAFGHSFVKSDG